MQRSREKKGLSTIIASVFMIAVIVIGLSTITSGLSFQNQLGQVVTERTSAESAQGKERIELGDVRISAGKLNATLVNTGVLPVKLVRLWVTNTTDPNGWHRQYDNLDMIINPGESLKDFGQELSLTAMPSSSYELKVVTERGSAINFKTISGSTADLNLVLTVVPPSVFVGNNATVILYVINDQNDAQAVHDISPTMNTPQTLNCGGANQPSCPSVTQKGSNPIPVETLTSGGTAAFKWVYNIGGSSSAAGAIVRFTATLGGNSISDELTITQITLSQTNFASQSGTVTIEYESLQWMQKAAASPYVSCPNWNDGWRVPPTGGPNPYTFFRINMTNHDPNSDIIIDKRSVFYLYDIKTGVAKPFFVAKATEPISDCSTPVQAYTVDATTTPVPPDAIILPKPAGETLTTKTLYFAVKTEGTGGSNDMQASPTGTYAGSFIIFGKLGSVMYGQNIPFMGIEVVT
jgi:hypothetical protein